MSIEAQTTQPRPTGHVRGIWQERYGNQYVSVHVDPHRSRVDTEIRVNLERRWGPQLCDVKSQDFHLSRKGAETLRDALTAALEWAVPAADVAARDVEETADA